VNGFLQDKNGNKSSKRLAGFIALGALFVVVGLSAWKGADMTAWSWPLVGLVGALFGSSVAER
jgi:uncharacterized membrane protein